MSDWKERAGRILLDPNDAHGVPLSTPLDRRWLWRIEGFLSVSGTTDEQRRLGHDLRQYLNETCEHHWNEYEGDATFEAHRQCMWCNTVEWKDGSQGSGEWTPQVGEWVTGESATDIKGPRVGKYVRALNHPAGITEIIDARDGQPNFVLTTTLLPRTNGGAA